MIEKLIKDYGKALYNFCLKITFNKYQAEDLYQETFLHIIRLQNKLDEKENIKAFIFSLANRIWQDKKKKYARRERIAPETSLEEGQEIPFDENIEDNLINKDMYYFIRNEIDKLDDKFKLVVIYFYYGELSVSEIAKIMNIPEGTVKSRLFNVKRYIKEKLEGEFFEN